MRRLRGWPIRLWYAILLPTGTARSLITQQSVVNIPTLPTIHLNGTGADNLYREYRAARKAISAASEALQSATCNARDFYPQEPGNWEKARAERARMFQLLQEVSDYVEHWEMHALDQRRS